MEDHASTAGSRVTTPTLSAKDRSVLGTLLTMIDARDWKKRSAALEEHAYASGNLRMTKKRIVFPFERAVCFTRS